MTTLNSDPSLASHASDEKRKSRFRIGDFYPVTSTLYNGDPATEILFQGCPWRCKNCNQSSLISQLTPTPYEWQDILYYLMGRRGLIDNVVFSGAEPLNQPHLLEAIVQCKTMGFIVGLHTCGIYPLRLGTVLPLVDWVWFEVLGMPEDYPDNNSIRGSGEAAWHALQLVLNYGVPVVCEIYCPKQSTTRLKLQKIAEHLAAIGVEHLILCVGNDETETLSECQADLLSVAPLFAHFSLRKGQQATL